jgi:hypothetical protein
MKPTKPDLDLAVSIAELSELPRLLKGRFDRSLRGVSNFWVALQFGWAPLLSDVKGMIKLQQTMHKRIMQLLRDNGRPVRREIKLEYERIVGDRVPERAYGIMSPIINGNFHSAVPTGVSWNTREYEIWASARFRYWLPKISDRTHLTKVLMRRLHGLEPTPSTIYNLVPWSWLVDWFTNVGEIISNLDAGIADRLAADYFYLMANERRTFYREVRAPMQVDNPWKSTKVYTSNSFTESEIKRRIRGSPFYPGLKDPDLSAIQLSILAALGYSRIRPTLD